MEHKPNLFPIMLLDEKHLPKVAFDGMNRVHSEELKIMNELYGALEEGKPEEEVDKLFKLFLEDVKKHFSFEEELMQKTAFFAYPIHKGEHDRVLKELESLYKEWREKGDREAVKRYLKKIFVPWLLQHIQTMDTATAAYLVQRLGFIPFE